MDGQNVTLSRFEPRPADSCGSVSWIHLGDLHMVKAGEQNDLDLGRIVDAINAVYAKGGVSFVFLPGDIADNGSAEAYRVVRRQLDRLQLPWCGIVGDHDVHERSFDNFRTYINEELTSSFAVGQYRFLRLNAFSEPRPDSFQVDATQMQWIEEELRRAVQQGQRLVLLLHCYPSDLKEGGSELADLVRRYSVLLVDMGHTHYNELSNDGRTIYSATRSTGQIEEGPVGFTVATVDGDAVSWDFVQPDAPQLVAITSPADRRLELKRDEEVGSSGDIVVHAKAWSATPVVDVTGWLDGAPVAFTHDGGVCWTGRFPADMPGGQHEIKVTARSKSETEISSTIEINVGERAQREFSPVDQDNAIGAWAERGILGTQLGPNKNGRKW